MIALSWNCRGLGHPVAVPFLCELVKVQKPDVIFLCETLSFSNKIEDVCVCLHYDCAFTINCIGRSGGLCVLWKSSANCSTVSFSQNHIDVAISDVDGNWRFTGFYGFPKRARRRLSWDLLRKLANVINLSWVVMGDFNNLLSSTDKKSGVVYLISYIRGFGIPLTM